MRHKGFTLIELITSIAIMATIISIALPSLLNAKKKQTEAKKRQAEEIAKFKPIEQARPPAVNEETKIYSGTIINIEVTEKATTIRWDGGKVSIIPTILYGEYKMDCVYTLYKIGDKYELRY